MMKATLIVVAACLISATSVASLKCPAYQFTSVDCFTGASAFAYQVGTGKCWVESEARCKGLAVAFPDKAKDILVKVGECKNVDIKAAAKALATAAVAVFAEVSSKVKCTKGDGYTKQKVCVYTKSAIEAEACAIGAAYAAVGVKFDDTHYCKSVAYVIAEAFATASAKAQQNYCLNKFDGKWFQTSAASAAAAVEKVLVTAIAKCWIRCDDPHTKEVEQKTKAKAHTEAKEVFQFGFAKGDADFGYDGY